MRKVEELPPGYLRRRRKRRGMGWRSFEIWIFGYSFGIIQ
jgi:hypothetical protein